MANHTTLLQRQISAKAQLSIVTLRFSAGDVDLWFRFVPAWLQLVFAWTRELVSLPAVALVRSPPIEEVLAVSQDNRSRSLVGLEIARC